MSQNVTIKHFPPLNGVDPVIARELQFLRTMHYQLLDRINSMESRSTLVTPPPSQDAAVINNTFSTVVKKK